MSEFFMVLKTTVLTVVLVLCMQVKVDGKTLETHLNQWIRNSSVGEYVQSVAQGGVYFINKAYVVVKNKANQLFGDENRSAQKASK